MILSAKVIKNPWYSRTCAECGLFIPGEQLKLYGYTDCGEKPYNLYFHLGCRDGTSDPKVQQALAEVSHLRKP